MKNHHFSLVLSVLFALTLTVLPQVSSASASCLVGQIPPSTPTSDFVDHGDGTVTHTRTGLRWMRCSQGQTWDGTGCTGSASSRNWFSWLSNIDSFNQNGGFAGFTDWRMPSVKELHSIVEHQCRSPAINTVVFPDTPGSLFWSASPYAGNSGSAWGVNFGNGGDNWRGKGFNHGVRLVRGGQ